MLGGGNGLRKAMALLGIGCAGAVGALAATPTVKHWAAEPEEQFLLEVSVRQLRLGDGVRAYNTPEGTCVVLGDFVAALDVPVKIDLAARKASGWAFKEEHNLSIDAASSVADYAGKREPIAPGTIRQTSEGWCVDSAALSRWFGISVKPVTSGSALLLESTAKLPVELAIERRKRAERLQPAKFDIATLPQVRLPYRIWRAPALDFVVSGGVTYRADTGAKVDRRTAVFAAGEIATMSYDAQFSTNHKGSPSTMRLRAYRSDPDGGLLGPLKATHAGIGDVVGFDGGIGARATSGRGGVVTNRPLHTPTSFDRTRIEGDLPAGWEAELYRNGELLGFTKPSADQRYVFEDVQLLYGENRIAVYLYGPQGQVRTREDLVNVGREHVPPGDTWYWAGANQPGHDLLGSSTSAVEPELQATVAVEHGLDTRTSVGALARTMLNEDERVTFIEGSIRRSIASALAEVSVSRDSAGGIAGRAQVLAKVASVNVSADALLANDFRLHDSRQPVDLKDYKLSLDAPLRLGRTVIPAHGEVRLVDRGRGGRYLEAAGRLSANLDRFNLATDVRYRRQYLPQGPAPPGELELSVLGAGRVGDVRLRSSLTATVMPEPRFRAAELSAYWSASDRVDWEGAVAYDAASSRARARVSHVRRLDSLALALTGEAASDGSLAFGFNLNFSLDSSRGLNFSRQPLAGAGVVHARVYRDLNDNGIRDSAEPLEKGALITAGTRVVDKPTDERGAVMVGGLATFMPLTVGVDASSLADPMLVPRKALQVVVPRPGVPAQVEIGLVGAGDIEGSIVKSGGVGFEGVALELVDSGGKPVATAQTDFDGFFLFERVPYGTYSIRVVAEAAQAAGISPDLNAQATVTPEKPIARLGALPVTPLPQLASRE